ncbi:MAG TPA: hypothetical protein VGE86_09145, partial [Thermoanaerobaculia bacterium]
VSLEQLTEQKNPRIIRQLYPNPLTGELDWALVPFGTPTPATNVAAGAVAPGAPQLPQQPTTPQPTTPATGAGGKQVGPFIGVRLAMTGDSIVPLNGQTKYEEWVYTINELQRDQAAAGGMPGVTGPDGVPRNPADPRFRQPQPPNPSDLGRWNPERSEGSGWAGAATIPVGATPPAGFSPASSPRRSENSAPRLRRYQGRP